MPFHVLDDLEIEDVIKVVGLYPIPFFSLKASHSIQKSEEISAIRNIWRGIHSQSATSSMSNSFGYSDSIQALRSYTTQTADKSMAGFTRLLNTTLNRQSGLQSADSSLDQVSSSMTSGSNQIIESNFNNGQSASINSTLTLSSSSSEKTTHSQSLQTRSS